MNSSIKTIQLIPPSQQSNSSINSSNQTYGITGGSGFSKQKSPKRSYQKKNSTKKGKIYFVLPIFNSFLAIANNRSFLFHLEWLFLLVIFCLYLNRNFCGDM